MSTAPLNQPTTISSPTHQTASGRKRLRPIVTAPPWVAMTTGDMAKKRSGDRLSCRADFRAEIELPFSLAIHPFPLNPIPPSPE